MDDQSTDLGKAMSRHESEGAISLTTVFELLARRPRRQALYRLHRRDDRSASLDWLVERLEESGAGETPTDDAEELRVSLHHVHLPKLDDAEVVDYDPDDGVVHYLGDPRLSALLEWGIEEEAPE